ncbi:MAG: hypothetical protein R3Y29_02965 [bacterium]
MTCENMFCIYQDLECEECTLEEISLDETGTCADCIYINIDEIELQKQKDTILDRYKDEYKKYDY